MRVEVEECGSCEKSAPLRNRILTKMGASLRFSLASLPIVGSFFVWPGVGAMLLDAIQLGNAPLVADLIVSLGLLFLVNQAGLNGKPAEYHSRLWNIRLAFKNGPLLIGLASLVALLMLVFNGERLTINNPYWSRRVILSRRER